MEKDHHRTAEREVADATDRVLAEWIPAAEFNRPDREIVGRRIDGPVGDGCLLEGRIRSLAGAEHADHAP